MKHQPSKFALCFGNRGFFPSSLIAEARDIIPDVLKAMGHESFMIGEDVLPYGAVETAEQGRIYAKWLRERRDDIDGVILSLPNFGDETGAVTALKDADVPIFIHAWPDELEKMSPEHRRDAFCGKLSIMDVFVQHEIAFTVLKPHVQHPRSDDFKANIEYLDRVCRVKKGFKDLTVGAFGARTTPFKTVRYDEVTLQRHGITVETLDLSDLFNRMDAIGPDDERLRRIRSKLDLVADWAFVPQPSHVNLLKLCAVVEDIINEYGIRVFAIRCWTELQEKYGISPCVINAFFMEQGVPAACELDVASAVTMYALGQASGSVTSILDWNNNYGDEEDKCILFHCGNVPTSLMVKKNQVTDHAILERVLGEERSVGCHQGRIQPFDFTYGNLITLNGRVHCYLGEGRFTEDPIPAGFFGCAGVAEIMGLQDVLKTIGEAGHRHHVALCPGHVREPMAEALEKYIGFQVMKV